MIGSAFEHYIFNNYAEIDQADTRKEIQIVFNWKNLQKMVEFMFVRNLISPNSKRVVEYHR